MASNLAHTGQTQTSQGMIQERSLDGSGSPGSFSPVIFLSMLSRLGHYDNRILPHHQPRGNKKADAA